jgi:hypothetical protein
MIHRWQVQERTQIPRDEENSPSILSKRETYYQTMPTYKIRNMHVAKLPHPPDSSHNFPFLDFFPPA